MPELRIPISEILVFNPASFHLGFAEDIFALEVKARAQEAGINLDYPYHRWIDPQTLEVVYWQAALCGGIPEEKQG